jgi:hypothetical protein
MTSLVQLLALFMLLSFFSSTWLVDVMNLPFPSFHTSKKKNPVYVVIKQRLAWEPIHKKYKANKSMRTHGTKEHNNRNTTNRLIKWTGFS